MQKLSAYPIVIGGELMSFQDLGVCVVRKTSAVWTDLIVSLAIHMLSVASPSRE
jgi:hypothetical protein